MALIYPEVKKSRQKSRWHTSKSKWVWVECPATKIRWDTGGLFGVAAMYIYTTNRCDISCLMPTNKQQIQFEQTITVKTVAYNTQATSEERILSDMSNLSHIPSHVQTLVLLSIALQVKLLPQYMRFIVCRYQQ